MSATPARAVHFPTHRMFIPKSHPLAQALIYLLLLAATLQAGPAQDAAAYADSIAKINDAHLKQPGNHTESDLAKSLPPTAKTALQRVLAANAGPETGAALLRCGEAALDL